jgi:ribulose-phosphate 3-epimerase
LRQASDSSREEPLVQAYVSLWSADLLDVGRCIDLVADRADGFHIDVFDGHDVDELLFGPDFVAAVRTRTDRLLDVHLNVTDPDHWARRFVDAGADMITVQRAPCPDVTATLGTIRAIGARASLGVEVTDDIDSAGDLAEHVDRYLVMGTELGIKGVAQDPRTPGRVTQLRDRIATARPIFVDGGIRPTTIGPLADAGTDGVIPGSLVFGAPDPNAALDELHALGSVPAGRPT